MTGPTGMRSQFRHQTVLSSSTLFSRAQFIRLTASTRAKGENDDRLIPRKPLNMTESTDIGFDCSNVFPISEKWASFNSSSDLDLMMGPIGATREDGTLLSTRFLAPTSRLSSNSGLDCTRASRFILFVYEFNMLSPRSDLLESPADCPGVRNRLATE